MYCRVIPFSKTFDFTWLIYFIPDHVEKELCLYQMVSIPVRDSIQIAIVFEIMEEIEESNISLDKIKSIIEIHDTNTFLYPYQAQIIEYISYHYITPIHNALGVYFPKNLQGKIEKKTFHKVLPREYNYETSKHNTLTSLQQKAYEQIQHSCQKQILFHGVTGSGKTEIYRKLISDNLQKNMQTLLLIPEIILGSQIGERISQMFGSDVLVIHSEVSQAKKTQYWRDIHSGNAKIIVGTRSAVFYPYKNLWMIIVDEEHDNSYISDSAPRYKTGDIVRQISQILNIPVVFASGTPSVQSSYLAMKGEMQLVTLLEKYK